MQLYEAHGELMAVTTRKTKLALQKSTTYEEYLAMSPARDVEATVPLNLSTAITGSSDDKVAQAFAENAKSSKSQGGGASSSGGHTSAAAEVRKSSSSKLSFTSRMGFSSKGKKERSSQGSDRLGRPSSQGSDAAGGSDPVKVQVSGTGRTVRARMWLTKESPINQKQLLPLLDILGSTNQYIIKVHVVRELSVHNPVCAVFTDSWSACRSATSWRNMATCSCFQ